MQASIQRIILAIGWQMMNRRKSFGCSFRLAVFCGFAAVGVISFAVLPHFAHADNAPASALFRSPQSTAQLVSAVAGTGDLESIPTAIHVALQPGWKTYWRSPGDAGYPMHVDSSGSTNVARVDLAWPVPHRFELFGLQTFGYGDEVAFPLQVIPERKGEAISLKAKLRYLVCEVICVPQDAQLSLDVPAGAAMPTAAAPLVNRFASLVPQGAERLGWSVQQVALKSPTELVVDLASNGDAFVAPDAIVEGARNFYVGRPKVELSNGNREARLILPVERLNSGPELAAGDVTLTIFDGARGMETKTRPAAMLATGAASDIGAILPVLFIALLGGLILNVMPCVLPVLMLKLTSVLDVAARERDHLRGAFLSTAAGIVASFTVLALGLIALKSAGAGIGWGIQFQQPAFLAFMALVCILFAANIWGLFEIPMPAFAGRAQLAADTRVSGHHAKSFFTGVLATALATPCSAPFVGTAVGFALARGPVEILAIFLALGLGLAAPYLAIAAAPELVRLLPRPGRWMRWLKGLLGITLLGTAIWLISIIGVQTGLLSGSTNGDRIAWTKFDEGAIAAQVADGKTVFVDVTADWCLTCQANKNLVLARGPVAARLQDEGIVAMKADWTNPDPAISAFLERHGRYGIPFNIVYGPAAPSGLKLPELLTDDAVLNALDSAAKRK
jgi:suppressor for copper-sensitivity B